MKKAVYFDLDGTVSDSAPGIMNAIVYLQKKKGLRELSEAELRACIGPPLAEKFTSLWNVDFETAEGFLDVYREYYNDTGIFENCVFDGIPEALGELNNACYELRICSAKPEVMVHRVLEHFNIKQYFTLISGSALHGQFPGKSALIKQTLQHYPAKAVMVGDRIDDISGAHGANIPGIGVLWGYGGKKELKDADVLISHPRELIGAVSGLILN